MNSLRLIDSKTSIELQLADLMASYCNYYFNSLATKKEDAFAKQIFDTGLINVLHNRMWPTTAVDPVELGMEDTSGVNPLDYLADQATLDPEAYAKVVRQKRKEKEE